MQALALSLPDRNNIGDPRNNISIGTNWSLGKTKQHL
jgi:hypothetical protein